LILGLGVALSAVPSPATAQTDRPVAELGGLALFSRPTGPPRGSVILMPGGDSVRGLTAGGEIMRLGNDPLVRTRCKHGAAGALFRGGEAA
jgi:hypothetical protein